MQRSIVEPAARRGAAKPHGAWIELSIRYVGEFNNVNGLNVSVVAGKSTLMRVGRYRNDYYANCLAFSVT